MPQGVACAVSRGLLPEDALVAEREGHGVLAAVARDLVDPLVLGRGDEFFRLAHDAAAIGATLRAPGGMDVGVGLATLDAVGGELAALLAGPLRGSGQGEEEGEADRQSSA